MSRIEKLAAVDKEKTVKQQIAGIDDLTQCVTERKNCLVGNGEARDAVNLIRFWFRGHAQADWTLTPKGLRSCPRMRAMLHEFRAEATILYDTPPKHHDLRQWLFLMQHYGMPTFLLDWTRLAMTALAFAVELDKEAPEQDKHDGALWMLRPGRWNESSGATKTFAIVEAYSPSLDELFCMHFNEVAEKNVSGVGQPSVTAIEPVYNSRRMMAQQGVFTIHTPLSKPMNDTTEFPSESCLWKMTIPSNKKEVIRQELHDLGIRVSSMFPDLDHLSSCIMRRYAGVPGVQPHEDNDDAAITSDVTIK